MQHRHLTHEGYTLAAIDDIIGRGNRADWRELGLALDADATLAAKIIRVCAAYADDPAEQRYFFWKRHAEKRTS